MSQNTTKEVKLIAKLWSAALLGRTRLANFASPISCLHR
jgi:hypothetical protein